MKRITKKQRDRDVSLNLQKRKNAHFSGRPKNRQGNTDDSWIGVKNWVDHKIRCGFNFHVDEKYGVSIILPEGMNFSDRYEETAVYIAAIRMLAKKRLQPKNGYKLRIVIFDELTRVSTSAALVLTAELSKWDDAVRDRLTPLTEKWNPDILLRFKDLGFFDLFRNHSFGTDEPSILDSKGIKVVRYIKGGCGDTSKARILKQQINEIVGEEITKWTFLHSGLSEAVTNVTHHAYPDSVKVEDKNWYLGGGFNEKTNELKIIFYDQGIGIPESLPASDVWEKALQFLSGFPVADRKKHEVLLKAAMELDRTSTSDSDRGKGLQDLLNFIKQRGDGYLSILSLKGLYKYSSNNGKEHIKSENFKTPIYGTLIIWKVTLTFDACK